ncbi:MAG: DUF5702 domain-containing protein [Lachnospira sp.]
MNEKGNKRKDASGQITVFASISIVLILSIILTCVKSVRTAMYTTLSKQAVLLATESVFGAYHDDMMKEYDLFLLKKSDNINDKLNWYVENNISSCSQYINVVSSEISECIRATDSGGEYFRAEIIEHMKYGIFSDILSELDVVSERTRKTGALTGAVEKITECDEELSEMDEDILKLLELVEGIDTNDTGFVLRNGSPVATREAYAKMLVNGEVSKENVNIHNNAIYDAMNYDYNLYLNVDEILKDISAICEDLKYIGDEESDKRGQMSCANIYSRDYEMIYSAVAGAKEKTDAALEVIEEYFNDKNNAMDKFDETMDYMFEKLDDLGQDVYDGMKNDLSEMKKSANSPQQKLCNIVTIKYALLDNKNALDSAKEVLDTMNVTITMDNCDEIIHKNTQCMEALKEYSLERLDFDYSKVDFSSTRGGISSIKKMYEELTDGFTGIVLKGKFLSDKTINYNNLAVDYETSFSSNQSLVKDMADAALFDEYLMTHFDIYTDYLEENSSDAETGALLDYTIEYIIGGAEKDSENIKTTIMEIALIRQGMNLSYIISDSGKRNEAYAMSAAFLGFTGSDAVIRVGQYLIMAFWAMGESVMDLRELYDGKRVEFVKTADTWKLSLVNLMSMQFESETAAVTKETDSTKKEEQGLSYKDYLRMLLFVIDSGDKNYRTMTAMELRMIEMGHEDFRMNNYIIAAKGKAEFCIEGLSENINQEIKYSYLEG